MASGVAERHHPATGFDRATLVVAGVVTLGVIMSILDTTIVNVALDALSRDLDAPLSTVQWVATGYLLSLAIVIPLAGWAVRAGSDRNASGSSPWRCSERVRRSAGWRARRAR